MADEYRSPKEPEYKQPKDEIEVRFFKEKPAFQKHIAFTDGILVKINPRKQRLDDRDLQVIGCHLEMCVDDICIMHDQNVIPLEKERQIFIFRYAYNIQAGENNPPLPVRLILSNKITQSSRFCLLIKQSDPFSVESVPYSIIVSEQGSMDTTSLPPKGDRDEIDTQDGSVSLSPLKTEQDVDIYKPEPVEGAKEKTIKTEPEGRSKDQDSLNCLSIVTDAKTYLENTLRYKSSDDNPLPKLVPREDVIEKLIGVLDPKCRCQVIFMKGVAGSGKTMATYDIVKWWIQSHPLGNVIIPNPNEKIPWNENADNYVSMMGPNQLFLIENLSRTPKKDNYLERIPIIAKTGAKVLIVEKPEYVGDLEHKIDDLLGKCSEQDHCKYLISSYDVSEPNDKVLGEYINFLKETFPEVVVEPEVEKIIYTPPGENKRLPFLKLHYAFFKAYAREHRRLSELPGGEIEPEGEIHLGSKLLDSDLYETIKERGRQQEFAQLEEFPSEHQALIWCLCFMHEILHISHGSESAYWFSFKTTRFIFKLFFPEKMERKSAIQGDPFRDLVMSGLKDASVIPTYEKEEVINLTFKHHHLFSSIIEKVSFDDDLVRFMRSLNEFYEMLKLSKAALRSDCSQASKASVALAWMDLYNFITNRPYLDDSIQISPWECLNNAIELLLDDRKGDFFKECMESTILVGKQAWAGGD